MHTYNLSDLRGGSRAGVNGCFHRRNVATEKTRDVTAANFFPADERDVGRFEGGVAGFEIGRASCRERV